MAVRRFAKRLKTDVRLAESKVKTSPSLLPRNVPVIITAQYVRQLTQDPQSFRKEGAALQH